VPAEHVEVDLVADAVRVDLEAGAEAEVPAAAEADALVELGLVAVEVERLRVDRSTVQGDTTARAVGRVRAIQCLTAGAGGFIGHE